MSKTKNKVILSVLILLLALSVIAGVFIFANPTATAHAASNTGIQTFYATETHNHNVSSYSTFAKVPPTDYTEAIGKNTGIKIYGTTNNGYTSSTSTLKSDSSTLCVDFTNANALYLPSNARSSYYDKTYSFQILSGNTVKWQATYTGSTYTEVTGKDENGNDIKTTFYKKVLNVNGRTTTTTSKESSLRHFSPSEFGANIISLSDGNYTVKITRSYYWSKSVESKFLFAYAYFNASSNMTGSLVVDTTAPTIAMRGYSTGKTIANGSYQKERVTFTASDSNFSRLYYKTPSSTSYSSTINNSYTTGTANGWYYVYAEDSTGHRSPEYSYFYDNTAPVGKIYSGGTTVSNGAYISKNFSYSATDNGSGVATYYYKTPTTGSYQQYSAGTIIPSNAGDGWYYFYSVDGSGNQSSTMSVYLETQAPLVEIYRNGTLSYSKNITASGSYDTGLYLRPNDTLKISCDTSSGKVTSNYSLDTNITIGNSYPNSSYTITLTSATGLTSNFTYHIVRQKPAFTIGGKTYADGSTVYLNADTLVAWNCSNTIADTANTGISISSEGNVNLNEFIAYKTAKSKTLTTAAGTETKYILTQTDRAGNTSTMTVYIDKLAPVGTWKTNGSELTNGGYTNKPLSFVFGGSGVTATYSYNGGEYAAYTSGKTFTADGTYTVVLTDRALNKSTFTAHIDTVAPTGQLYADYKPVNNGAITNGKIYFSWDGDASATVNGRAYEKNAVLTADSAYNFVLTDLAGNKATYTITIDTVAPSYNTETLNGSAQMISKWYTVTLGDKEYSFADYEEALAFACQNEFANAVTVLNLDDVKNFNQYHLVADNGNSENTDDEVREGEYWLYKSKANPDSLLYYFDRNLLNEVIARYAKEHISTMNYLEFGGKPEYGTPSDSMSDNMLTAPDGTTAPVLNGFVFEQIDSAELFAELVGGNGTRVKVEFGKPFGEQFNVGGLYKLTEIDDAKNESVYYGFVDVLAPELNITATIFGNAQPTELTISKDGLSGVAAYYYESFHANEIIDADKWAVLTVENGGKTEFYTYGDNLPCLNVGGEYILSLYDRFGNGYSFTVYIVGSPAAIEFKNNSDDTAFGLKISLEQTFDTLVSLEIKRNDILLDDVSTDTLAYTFDRAGVYTVTLRDNFGRIIEREYTFVKALPSGELSGVENNGKTKNDVTFTYDNGKYFAAVTKDGKTVETANGGELKFTANDANSGAYLIRLINLSDDENYSDYAFCINTLAPEFSLSVNDGTITNKNVTVSWTATDIEQVTYSINGGEAVVLKNGQALLEEGSYTVIATNDLGTTNEKTFVIDKTLDYYVTVGEQVANVETTSETVAVFSNEKLYVSVTKNGEAMDYSFGDILSDEALYAFRITDDYGNAVTFSITIDKSVDFTANVGNGLISNGGVVFVNGEKLTVTLTKDKEVIDYSFGQSIDAEGEYRAILRDSFGNEKTVEFRIVSGVKRALDYTLGTGVEVLSVEHGGEPVNVENNRLNFTVDGVYTVTARADGQTYSFVLELDATAPTIELKGVENGGVAGGKVSIDKPSETAKIEVYKDGELIEYELGGELNEYGEYRVIVTDSVGNTSEYSFTLAHVLNGGAIAFIVIGILALAGAIVLIVVMRKKGKFGKNKGLKTDSKTAKKD